MDLHAAHAEAIAKQIAEEIRVEMARQKKSRRALAAVLSASEHTIGGRISGRSHFNSVELIAVANWLGLTIGDLIERAEARVADHEAQHKAEAVSA